jgi:hypothetical protein
MPFKSQAQRRWKRPDPLGPPESWAIAPEAMPYALLSFLNSRRVIPGYWLFEFGLPVYRFPDRPVVERFTWTERPLTASEVSAAAERKLLLRADVAAAEATIAYLGDRYGV